MKNVIDMTERLKNQVRRPAKAAGETSAPIIDMTEMRTEMINQERRRTKRTILSDFVGAFVLVPRRGLLRVTLYDISDKGLAFDVSEASGHFTVGEEVAMRVYLNQETYFTFLVRVQNIRGAEDETVFRHGAGFHESASDNEALKNFVKFVEAVSAQLQTDSGDLQVSSSVR